MSNEMAKQLSLCSRMWGEGLIFVQRVGYVVASIGIRELNNLKEKNDLDVGVYRVNSDAPEL